MSEIRFQIDGNKREVIFSYEEWDKFLELHGIKGLFMLRSNTCEHLHTHWEKTTALVCDDCDEEIED